VRWTAALLAASILTIAACGAPASPSPTPETAPSAAILVGRVSAVPLPAESRLAVQVCPDATRDCGRWLYPQTNGEFRIELLSGRYSVAVFLETRNGIVLLTTSDTTLPGNQTTVLDLVVGAIPSYPST
jgi:hypothetical protein